MPVDFNTSWEVFRNEFIVNRGYTRVLNGLENTLIIAIAGLILGITFLETG